MRELNKILAATDGSVKRLRMEDVPGLTAKSFMVMNGALTISGAL